jgi:hypothetical protein
MSRETTLFIKLSRDAEKSQGGAQPNGQHFLDPRHVAELRDSDVREAHARRAGLYSIASAGPAARLLHMSEAIIGGGPWLTIPFPRPDGTPSGFTRLKPFEPPKWDKPPKYLSPSGSHSEWVYYPPNTLRFLTDPSMPLVVVEGKRKALCLDANEHACVGLTGVDCWSVPRPPGPDGKRFGPLVLNSGLRAVAWTGRKVYVAFDSDAATKDGVLLAERRLAQALRTEGAEVFVVRVPGGKGGVP